MRIIDLIPEYEPTFFACLKDWEQERAVGDHKRRWYAKMKARGLRVKLALDDAGRATGMIQVVPIEHSRAEGSDLAFIQCIWVHGYDEGMGNVQGRGTGEALLQATEDDARSRGTKGMAAWGLPVPDWMPVAWYEKHGYVEVDRMGYDVLVWKPFQDDARPPRWVRRKKTPAAIPGQVTVTAFINGWCQAGCGTFELVRRAAAAFGEQVVFREIDTSDRSVFLEWGIQDAVFVDDDCISDGPPLGYEQVKAEIERRLKAVHRSG